jgi:hypothetical protein
MALGHPQLSNTGDLWRKRVGVEQYYFLSPEADRLLAHIKNLPCEPCRKFFIELFRDSDIKRYLRQRQNDAHSAALGPESLEQPSSTNLRESELPRVRGYASLQCFKPETSCSGTVGGITAVNWLHLAANVILVRKRREQRVPQLSGSFEPQFRAL